MEIKVKPEQLEQIAKNISEMQTHSQNIQQNLNQSMFSIQMQWQGATSQHFYGEYMRSMRLMESYIRNLQVTEKELRRIAQKFRQADEEYQKKQNEKLKETHKKEKKHEKSWWEKGVEGAAEFIGVNDAIRAVTGKDPITGKELSSKERLIAAGWTLLNFVPVGKVASLAGKGIKYVASSFGKTIVKAGKRLGEGVTMVAGKAGKAAVDGIKTASHKVKEGVNFVASTAKGFADKIGSLWNKGATTVKTTFLQGNEKIQHAVKTLLEYKWIPGEGKGFAVAGVGRVSGGGQYSLKEAYQYMESKVVKGTGEATPKKKSVPDWLKERWEAGNNFNKENRPRYPYNEVELEVKEVGGKKYVVDSYAHNKEIVSRKFTQLSEVQEKTAKSYLNEITKKYPSGSKISNGPFNPNALKGGRLKGELILEVPVQNKPIPQTILDEATKNRIIIRDIKGKVYN
ncbi:MULTISPECIES: WXG100 family type VII secretion target [Bacillus]|uniref:WXG100 family type VII secretion target n=1 Tax=Bacillus TaxID=1386 RepID=UPI0023DC1A0A|nr:MULTISPECIES: WXG100 family type VII secretion target [unclassified Bacillus (in: firmicutes)]MCU4760074.1 WXG100 family type VII secretion target [Bacillus cereus]MDF2017614.1 WXG100 family type VII secretion target [Bacillus sp. Cr_R3]MDF2030984.1 WXG100 family type VII secretion target [Bacillus sp. Cr_R16]HDR7437417.1 WXG100 family type VII secretion target [Bacillus anthracis]